MDGSDYLLTTADQIKYRFDNAGKLQAISNVANNAITLNYAGAVVDSVVDTSGRVFDLATNAAGLVTQITDPTGRVVTYTYGAATAGL